MVNKNNASVSKLVKEEPNLTIYPFSLDDLKKSGLTTKTASKTKKSAKITNTTNTIKSAQNEKQVEKSTEIQKNIEATVNPTFNRILHIDRLLLLLFFYFDLTFFTEIHFAFMVVFWLLLSA